MVTTWLFRAWKSLLSFSVKMTALPLDLGKYMLGGFFDIRGLNTALSEHSSPDLLWPWAP